MDNANTDAGILDVPTFKVQQPGAYKAQLLVEDVWCDPLTFNFDIKVYYPADIFAYKFNNVLAVYKYGRGGNRGWEFTGYQWYRNGEPINGATESVCHIDGTFAVNDEVYVVLLDKNGQIIPSCPQTIETVPSFSEQSNDAPARKMIVNRQMVIIKGDKTYDIYGQRVQ